LLTYVFFISLFLYCVFGVPLCDVCSFRFPFYGASSSVSRKVTIPLLLSFSCSFHRDRFRTSMYSCSVSSRCWIRVLTSIAVIHDIAHCLFGDRFMYCGHVGQSSGMWSEVVLRISAIFLFVHCHVSVPCLHS
jgi:hypothetical protein